jgi:hypothetical protein
MFKHRENLEGDSTKTEGDEHSEGYEFDPRRAGIMAYLHQKRREHNKNSLRWGIAFAVPTFTYGYFHVNKLVNSALENVHVEHGGSIATVLVFGTGMITGMKAWSELRQSVAYDYELQDPVLQAPNIDQALLQRQLDEDFATDGGV